MASPHGTTPSPKEDEKWKSKEWNDDIESPGPQHHDTINTTSSSSTSSENELSSPMALPPSPLQAITKNEAIKRNDIDIETTSISYRQPKQFSSSTSSSFRQQVPTTPSPSLGNTTAPMTRRKKKRHGGIYELLLRQKQSDQGAQEVASYTDRSSKRIIQNSNTTVNTLKKDQD